MRAPRSPGEAAAAGYRPVERWDVGDVLLFVRRELGERTYWLVGHAALLAALAALGAVVGYREVVGGARLFGDIALPLAGGFALMAVAVVPHELIHGLAYRAVGARSVTYGADWRRLVFHASAPGFVLDYRRLRVVALAPFAVITALLAAWLSLAAGPEWWAGYGLLLVHTQGCLGDAAMLNAFARRVDPAAWLTYDDPEAPEFVFLKRGAGAPDEEEGATRP